MPKANKWGEDGRGSGAPGAGLSGRRRGGGSPFWPLSAAYQERERKAHKQKSSSVRKVPLRSLISPGARRAPAGPRPHGPGDRGRGTGARRRRGPRPRRNCGPGRDRYGQGGNRVEVGGACGLLLRGARRWRPRSEAGPGQSRVGARRQEPRPGWIRDRRRVDGRRAGRPGFKGAASLDAAGSTGRGRGRRPAPGIPAGPPRDRGTRVE